MPDGMSDRVSDFCKLLRERGTATFRDFMELALYDPRHGYYGAGRAGLGRGGDYYTSVSVGPMFGALLGAQFREMWDRLGRPGEFAIVEQGANDGAFAADVLAWTQAQAPEFFEALRYRIAEPLAILRGRQGERLAEFAGKVAWSEQVERFTGVHFSNELIDAFPVHRVRFAKGEWRELCVTPDLEWTEAEIENGDLRERLAGLPKIERYTTEIHLDALRWAADLASKLERGWVLAIDYGYPWDLYYTPERSDGTLQSYAGHRRGADPLANPGECDLTAHVEFTSLTRAFLTGGLELAGFTDQHHFLTGIVSAAFADGALDPRQLRALKTLLHPELMGTSFKVLGVSRGVESPALSGFKFGRNPAVELGL